MLIGAERVEAQAGELVLGGAQVGAEVLGLVGVGARRYDGAAEVAIEREDLTRGHKAVEFVANARGVELDALAIGDDAFEDRGHDVADLRKGALACGVVAADEVEVPEHVVVVVGLDELEKLLVVGLSRLGAGVGSLKFAVPKLEVVDLVHGADHKVELVAESADQVAVLFLGDGLSSELQARTNLDLARELGANIFDFCQIGFIGAVGYGATVFKTSASRIAPLRLNAVVHMLGKANLVQVEPDGVECHLAQRIGGIVGVSRVNVEICQHGVFFKGLGFESVWRLTVYSDVRRVLVEWVVLDTYVSVPSALRGNFLIHRCLQRYEGLDLAVERPSGVRAVEGRCRCAGRIMRARL